ncbi:hypothetical protein [Cryptosporangium aurantiacum]|uniref:hypothetical protein n=1 Tax=Cryptosporangium aurantiacum TaxID=134849 RepID=UPI0015BB1F75|nr:hypothetical protein [Cryptosporangium aurantiacum]
MPGPVKRPLPTTIVWRWRYEVLVFLAISLAASVLIPAYGLAETLLPTGVSVALVAAVGPLRRAVVRWVLCVATEHRVRAGLAQAWVHNRRGRLPAIVRTRRTPYGEAVLLWCPAGICARHVRAAAPVLRAACWAQHVHVTADVRRAHLVTVHVVRRNG